MKMKSLISGAMVYGLINMIQKSASILLVPIYLVVLSTEEFGSLEIVIAIYAFISHLFMLQMEGGFQRFFYDYKKNIDKRLYLSSNLLFVFITHLIGAAVLLFSKDYITANFLSSELVSKYLFIILSMNLVSRSSTTLLLIALRFNNKKYYFGISAITDTIVTSILAIIFLVQFSMGIAGIYLAQFISSIIANVIMIYFLRNEIVFDFSAKYIKPCFNYSIYLLPGVMVGWSLSHYNRIYMSLSNIGLGDIAIYGLANKFSLLIIVSLSALKLVWEPEAINSIGKKGSRLFYSRVFDYYVCFLILSGIFITIFLKIIIQVIAPPEYYNAYFITPILIASTILNCSTIITSMGITIAKKTIYISIASIIAALCNIIIMTVGINLYGVNAVVLAYAISSMLIAIFTLIFSQLLYPIPYKVITQFSLIFCCVLISVYPLSDNYLIQIIIVILAIILCLMTLGNKELNLIKENILNLVQR